MKNSSAVKHIVSLCTLLTLVTISCLAIGCPVCKQEQLRSSKQVIVQKCTNLGGYQLYLQTVGKQGPPIIFEAGLGDSSSSWDKITPQVAKFAQAIAYDRSGLGRSQAKPNQKEARTAQDAVEELRQLLAKNHIKPPYILVGHSLGGLYMQLFAQQYPHEVSGVVLVDSATREQSGDESLPPEDASYYLEAAGIKASIEQVRNAPAFPDIPLTILTSGQRGKGWLQLQKALTKLSTKSKQLITNDSGHHIQKEEPNLVVATIEEMANKIRILETPNR